MIDGAVGRRDRHVRRIGSLQQVDVELELPFEVGLEHRLARRREQRDRKQVHRRDRGRRVDAAHDFAGDGIHRLAEPGRSRILVERRPGASPACTLSSVLSSSSGSPKET